MPRRQPTGDCALCPYTMDCLDHKDGKKKCTVSVEPPPAIDTPAEIRELQRKVVVTAAVTLQRGERLAQLGNVPLESLSDLRRQVFIFTKDMLKDVKSDSGGDDEGGSIEDYLNKVISTDDESDTIGT